MRIGIDIDGVLNDVGTFEIDYGSKFYIEHTSRHLDNPHGDGSYEIFTGSLAEDTVFWKDAIYTFVKVPARPFAAEVISKLREMGHEIYIVTARTSDLSYCDISPEKMKKIVVRWLKKNKIFYNQIVWTGKEKVAACLENKINLMIEDSPKHISAVSKHIQVFCYSAPYNQNCAGNNITRCYSWYDILDKIRKQNEH